MRELIAIELPKGLRVEGESLGLWFLHAATLEHIACLRGPARNLPKLATGSGKLCSRHRSQARRITIPAGAPVTPPNSRRLALVMAVCSAAALLSMVATSLVTGATQETHEHYKLPADYARDLLAHPGGTRLLFGLDVAFLILYTAFFGALASYLRGLGRPLMRVAFGAMVVVAVLDIIENHHILSLLSLAEAGRPIDDSSIAFQEVLSSTKFSISYLSLFLFGLAIPRTTLLDWVLALFLTVGNLFTGVLGFAAPPAWRESLDSGRWIGFLLGFVLAFLWLRGQPDHADSAAPHAAG